MNTAAGSARGPMRFHRLKPETDRPILPSRVFSLYQGDLPVALPGFELLFPRDRSVHRLRHLEIDEPRHTVPAGKTSPDFVSMLPEASDRVRGHSDVQRTVTPTREDVDAGLPIHLHRMGCSWMLN